MMHMNFMENYKRLRYYKVSYGSNYTIGDYLQLFFALLKNHSRSSFSRTSRSAT